MEADAKDIEVLILTCNRSALLKIAIESLLSQTLTGFSITVMDNASTDDTAKVVASFNNPNVRIVSAEKNLGALGNIQRAQQFASRQFLMMFHDDDQLHPEYLEKALGYLNKRSDVGLVVSHAVNLPAGSKPVIPVELDQTCLMLDRVHFASLCYIKNKIAFSSAVYRTNNFKLINLAELSNNFGKWLDRPIMIEALQNQSCLIMEGAFTYSGRHEGQDQHAKTTQPPHTSWLNRERYFLGVLGDKWNTFSGKCFCMQSHRRLKSGYKRRIVAGVRFHDYLRDAFAIGATTARAWGFRYIAIRPMQYFFNLYAQRYLHRHFVF